MFLHQNPLPKGEPFSSGNLLVNGEFGALPKLHFGGAPNP
jgi:hypothetical protein